MALLTLLVFKGGEGKVELEDLAHVLLDAVTIDQAQTTELLLTPELQLLPILLLHDTADEALSAELLLYPFRLNKGMRVARVGGAC